ncbi:MAG: fibronectin type III domain-containing protein, partial [candidate division KSB1 bacterium]
REPSGVLALSEDFTFTTLPTPPLFADNFNSATLDLNKWQRGSNSENQSAVVNNELELRSQSTQSGWVITKQAFIAQNTTVTAKITQPNDDGALGMSPSYKLSSASGIYGEENWYRFYVYRETPGNYRLYVEWLKAGVKDGIDATGNLAISGAVYLRLRMDTTNVYFEASLDGQQWTTTYNEAFSLPGYTLSNKFYYELAASRTAVRGVMRADDFMIEGAAPLADTQAPVLSNVVASNVTTNAATITWTTNEASDAQVEYGLTSSYGSLSLRDSSLSTAHALTLTNLLSDTTYHFRVLSRGAAGNLAKSASFTFKTLAGTPSNVLLADDFNGGTLDANKWLRGTNSGNQAAVSNNALQLQATGSQSGWVTTKQAYVARNTTVAVQVTQANNDGALGISPTFSLSSTVGFHNQNNWYRFYVYREQARGPYRLYVEWKKAGVVGGIDVTNTFVISGAVYLRLRFDEAKIYFEASLDNTNWTTSHSETFALPGSTLNSSFYYELSAYKTSSNGAMTLDDFSITSNNAGGALAKAPSENESLAAIPENFALSQNFPNPFNIETRVHLDLPEAGRVQAVIYNLQGQEVKRVHDAVFTGGTHLVQWIGTNERNETVSSGVYLLRLIFEGESGKRVVATRRLVLMK